MEWHILLAAVATSTSFHRVMEPGSIRYKLRRLGKATETGKIEKPPLKNIDTRAKSYALSLTIVTISTLLAYVLFNALNLSTLSAIQYSIAVIIFADVLSMILIDKYHVEIEVLTQKFKKN